MADNRNPEQDKKPEKPGRTTDTSPEQEASENLFRSALVEDDEMPVRDADDRKAEGERINGRDRLVEEAYGDKTRTSGEKNDYHNAQAFDNPYDHIGKALELAQKHGIDFAVKEFEKAIEAADRIDQKSVETDRLANLKTLQSISRQLESGLGDQGQLRQMQATAVRTEQTLTSLYLAPAAVRIEMAANMLKSGKPEFVRLAEQKLEEAFEKRPELKTNKKLLEILDNARKEGAARASDQTEKPVVKDGNSENELNDIKIAPGRRRWRYVEGTGEAGGGDLKEAIQNRKPEDILDEQKEAEKLAKDFVAAMEEHRRQELARLKEQEDYENPDPVDLPAPVPPGTAERLAKNPLAWMLAGYLGWKVYKKGKNWYARRTGGSETVDSSSQPGSEKEADTKENKGENTEKETEKKEAEVETETEKNRQAEEKTAEAKEEGKGTEAKQEPVERKRPSRRRSVSTTDAVERTETVVRSDGTVERTAANTGQKAGDRTETEWDKSHTEAVRREIARLEEEIKKTGDPESRKLLEALRMADGKYGAELQVEARTGIMERLGRNKKALGGAAVGIAILTTAALAWYLSRQRNVEEAPLRRSTVSGK